MIEEKKRPSISIIIINWNGKSILDDCLRSISTENGEVQVEIIVVDNGSTDGSVEWVRAGFPHVRLIQNSTNRGFAAANNQAMKVACGEIFILLNSDAALRPGALSKLVDTFGKNPQIGIVGPLLLNDDESIQPSFGCFASLRTEIWFQFFFYKLLPSCFPYGRRIHRLMNAQYHRQHKVDWVTGACLAVRRSVVEQVGGMSESSFMYGEDMEWCYQVGRAGFEVIFQPEAKVIHRQGYSSHRNYSSWIERYTTGQLRFLQTYRSEWVSRMAGLVVCMGSVIRVGAWWMYSRIKPGRMSEASQRIHGYKKAFSIGKKVFLGYKFDAIPEGHP